MHLFMSTALLMIVLSSSSAQAADPHLTKQITVLQQQIVGLQQELNRLKNVVTVVPDGATRITAQQHKQERTGGHSQAEVGGNQNLRIKGLSDVTIKGGKVTSI